MRDRAFFFVNYEGFREVSRQVAFSGVPTMAQRQGVMGKPVVNPLTGELYADGVIPASAIAPFARKVLAGLPAPTRPGTSNNFDTLPRAENFNDKVDIKIDQQLRPSTSAFVRFSPRKVDNFEPPDLPGETSSPSNAFVEVLNQQLAIGATQMMSSGSIGNVNFPGGDNLLVQTTVQGCISGRTLDRLSEAFRDTSLSADRFGFVHREPQFPWRANRGRIPLRRRSDQRHHSRQSLPSRRTR
jgi:hypothetical protein